MMDELGNLSAFLKVVERGSLTSAASALNCSTSTVSKRIKQLEHTVGATLLYRSTHGVARPTEAGQAYFEQVRAVMGGLEHAKDVVRHVTKTLTGRLRVHLTPGASLLVLPAITRFAKTYPSLDLMVSVRPEHHDVLQRGFDLAIHSAGLDDEEIGFTSVEARKLVAQHYLICAAPSYLEEHGTPAVPADLAGHNCLVSIRQPSSSKWWFGSEGRPYAVTVRGSFESDNWITVRDAARAGLGIARMASVAPGIDPGDGLVELFPGQAVSDRALWAMMPRMHPTPRKVELFLSYLADELTRIATPGN